MESVKMLIEQQLLYGAKQTIMSIVTFGSDSTDNPLNEKHGGGYDNIHSFHPFEKVGIDLLRDVDSIEPSAQEESDWINGLLVGIDMITEEVGTKKFKKRVFLITDGESELMDADDLDTIA